MSTHESQHGMAANAGVATVPLPEVLVDQQHQREPSKAPEQPMKGSREAKEGVTTPSKAAEPHFREAKQHWLDAADAAVEGTKDTGKASCASFTKALHAFNTSFTPSALTSRHGFREISHQSV
jgi:hypothetical protein